VILRADLIGGIPAEEIPLITERQAGTYPRPVAPWEDAGEEMHVLHESVYTLLLLLLLLLLLHHLSLLHTRRARSPPPPPSVPLLLPVPPPCVSRRCGTHVRGCELNGDDDDDDRRRGCLLFRGKNRELSKEKRKRKKRSTASIKRIEGTGDDRSSRPPRRLKPLVFVRAAAASLSWRRYNGSWIAFRRTSTTRAFRSRLYSDEVATSDLSESKWSWKIEILEN